MRWRNQIEAVGQQGVRIQGPIKNRPWGRFLGFWVLGLGLRVEVDVVFRFW